MPQTQKAATLVLVPDGHGVTLKLSGDWFIREGVPSADEALQSLTGNATPASVRYDGHALGTYDSGLLTFIIRFDEACAAKGIKVDDRDLPDGVRQLLELARGVPEKEGTRSVSVRKGFFTIIGDQVIAAGKSTYDIAAFTGEMIQAFAKACVGKARFRWSDTFLVMQQCGAEALPIVTLISFLVGVIMAYVGAVQLAQFGATIYIANLVGLAMVREMGAMMTGIIMCGRTGAAFAAQLGSMKVSEEISALRTLGIPPMEFLVLPRLIALFLMMPLLTIYANFIGMAGGWVVANSMGITTTQYVMQLMKAMDLANFSTGIIKSVFFGGIVAVTGCLRGMQCGSSSAAVGLAATSAVVSGITLLIASDAIFAVIFQILGI